MAGLASIVYNLEPSAIVEMLDQRMESIARPVVRVKGTFSIPAGDLQLDNELLLNCVLKEAVFYVPTLGVGTVTVSILDEMGAIVYTKAALAAGITADPNLTVPLAGRNTLRVTFTNAQSSTKVVYVLLYGL